MGFEPLDFAGKKKHGMFYRQARILWHLQQKYRSRRGQQDGGESSRVLEELYGPVRAKTVYQQFGIRKNEKLLAVFWLGMGLTAVLFLASAIAGSGGGITELERPLAGSDSILYELEVQNEEGKVGSIQLEVPPRQLTAAEKQQLLAGGEKEWNAWLQEQGIELDALSQDIRIPDNFCGGLVEVRLDSSDYDLVDGTGRVNNALVREEGEFLELSVVLTCGEEQKILVCPARVMPAGQDEADRLTRAILRQMAEEETQTESDIILLPDEFEGRKLDWQLAQPSYGIWFAFLTLAGCIVLNAAFEQDLRKEGEKRREALLYAYPAFLSRLILFAGTGMPLRNIFLRMAKKAEKPHALPVYEEVLRTCREMESGVTQLHAYENFGRRCKLPQYKKCASLLMQNVRRGSSGMLDALNQEAVTAFEERRALARKKGEEAQTKLILPMLMMLVVVMILIMVPACFSFGGW